jgi:putative ABC transport system permease protein
MFLFEGLSLGIAGAVLGNMVGTLIIVVLNASHITYDFGRQTDLLLQVTIDPVDLAVLSVIVIVISVIASLQPAFKASRMEPIKALRHV